MIVPMTIARQQNSPPFTALLAYYANHLMVADISMPTRNIVLTERQSELVERLVASGRYQNASEVLREGLRLIETREAEEKARLKTLREAARIGVADLEAGRYETFETADALETHVKALMAGASARIPSPRGR